MERLVVLILMTMAVVEEEEPAVFGSQLDHAFNMALEIVNTSGGAYAFGGSGSRRGGTGGNGRVIQVYFDSKADDLQVTDGVQSQFRILRSVPIGQNTFL